MYPNGLSFNDGVDKEIFDLQSAADHLGHSRRWLRENCVSFGIEHVRSGRKFRFTSAELERFLAVTVGAVSGGSTCRRGVKIFSHPDVSQFCDGS